MLITSTWRSKSDINKHLGYYEINTPWQTCFPPRLLNNWWIDKLTHQKLFKPDTIISSYKCIWPIRCHMNSKSRISLPDIESFVRISCARSRQQPRNSKARHVCVGGRTHMYYMCVWVCVCVWVCGTIRLQGRTTCGSSGHVPLSVRSQE